MESDSRPHQLRPLHLVALDVPHLVNDALKNALQGFGAQRTFIVAGHVMEHLVFALRLIDWQREILLDAPNLFDDARTFVQQRQEFEIDRVDLWAAFGEPWNAHGFFDVKPLASSRAIASSFVSRSG